jgi:hypothetical protein
VIVVEVIALQRIDRVRAVRMVRECPDDSAGCADVDARVLEGVGPVAPVVMQTGQRVLLTRNCCETPVHPACDHREKMRACGVQAGICWLVELQSISPFSH